MIPIPQYTVTALTVYRVIGPDGEEVDLEDDHGSYPLDFHTAQEAWAYAQERMQLPVHGPMTLEEQKRAEQNARLWETVAQIWKPSLVEMLKRPTPFLPPTSNRTITFHR